jgi:CRP-like cAMP-binding protein
MGYRRPQRGGVAWWSDNLSLCVLLQPESGASYRRTRAWTEALSANAEVCPMTTPDRTTRAAATPTNRLLDLLPPDEAAQFLPQLTRVHLRHAQLLYQVGEPIPRVAFPLTALVSLLIVLEDGKQVEMAAVGREGFAGLPLALGMDTDGHQAITQIPGEALVLGANAFRAALATLPGLRAIMDRYALVLLTQSGQSAACNAHHAINERCARWLLEAHDRVGADEFALTQDFLSAMLGVHRPSVTVAAAMLQQAGLITYRRGCITILDRPRLEDAACECYRFIASETSRLLDGAAGACR